jgi:hypothetical protein
VTSPRLATPRSGSVLGVINCFLALCSNSWLSKPRGPSRAFIGEPMQQSVHGRLDGAPRRKSRETRARSPARCVRNIQSSFEPFRLLHRSSSVPFHVRRSGVVAVAFSPLGKRRPPLASGFAGVGDEALLALATKMPNVGDTACIQREIAIRPTMEDPLAFELLRYARSSRGAAPVALPTHRTVGRGVWAKLNVE